MTTRRAAAILLFATGCVRPVVPAGAQVAGGDCSSDVECRGGFCSRGTCCDSRCDGADERCSVPGSRGTCTTVKPGDPCADSAGCAGRAPHCVDGVCCDTPCSGVCLSCVNPAQPGRCMVNVDNTDPRHECGAPGTACLSCVEGRCAPSIPATDPEGECGSGMTCNGLGSCARGLGAECRPEDHCAVGECVAGRCRQFVAQAVDFVNAVPGQNVVQPYGVSTNTSGRHSMVVRTGSRVWDDSTGDFRFDPGPILALVHDGERWSNYQLDWCSVEADWAGAVRYGPATMVVVGRYLDRPWTMEPCHPDGEAWSAYVLGPRGEYLTRESIPGLPDVGWFDQAASVGVSAEGAFQLAQAGADGELMFAERGTAGAGGWQARQIGEGSAGSVSLVYVEGVPVVIDFAVEEPQLRATVVREPLEISRVSLPADCLVLCRMDAAASGSRVQLAFTCDCDIAVNSHTPGMAELDLSAPPDARWTTPDYLPLAGDITQRSLDAVPVTLSTGESGVVYIDGLFNLGIAYQVGGQWVSSPLLTVPITNFVERLRASSSLHGATLAWGQRYRDEHPATPITATTAVMGSLAP